jgi:hypothetical protein
MTELTKIEDNSIINVIAKAAADPNVDVAKLEKLLNMQERVMDKQAENDYNIAMANLQPKIPQIDRTRKADKSKYAPYEEIDRVLRPLYTEAGFSISFNSRIEGDKMLYTASLAHKGGHSKTADIVLPADTSGSKNALQAMGSTTSYAKRYLLSMLFNVVTTEEDNDGNLPLPNEEAVEIDLLITETKTDKAKFLKWLGADSVQTIPSKNFLKARTALKAKLKKVGA